MQELWFQMEHSPLLSPNIIAVKLVVHQLVMHPANADNKKLHSSQFFLKLRRALHVGHIGGDCSIHFAWHH